MTIKKSVFVCKCIKEGKDQSCCRNYIDFDQDDNCVLVAVENSGSMNLREISQRFGLTHVRIKQIEDKAIAKLRSLCENDEELNKILIS